MLFVFQFIHHYVQRWILKRGSEYIYIYIYIVNCHFDETAFLALEGEIKQLDKDITWKTLSLLNFNPRTKQYEQEVQKIFCLQNIANQLPNTFTDSKE